MTQDISVPYDPEYQAPIPSIWKDTIIQVIEAFKNKNFECLNTISNVQFIDLNKVSAIAANVDDYGAHLISLPEESWNTSVCLYGK